MSIIAGKWKPAIIYALVMNGTLHFTELRRLVPKVSQWMLTPPLRDLERHGLEDGKLPEDLVRAAECGQPACRPNPL